MAHTFRRSSAKRANSRRVSLLLLTALTLALSACLPAPAAGWTEVPVAATSTPGPAPTPLPSRPPYNPGELVDYVAQPGDTLPALAAHFNTRVAEIRLANPDIPADATTMPPGMPMKIPIYYLQFWGTPFRILPDNLFVNGPSAAGFDTEAFVAAQPGWLKDYNAYAGGANRTGAQIVDYVAVNYSLSPRLLLALLEFQTGALSRPQAPDSQYPLGHRDYNYAGLYLQLVWAANTLNNGYYGWRTGRLTSFTHPDTRLERPDPWQNAASVAMQYYYSRLYSGEAYARSVGPTGFSQTYWSLFGDPWAGYDPAFMPVSLQQPALALPFPAGETWAYTGGPHTGWGRGDPFAAIDFAPATAQSGCYPTEKYATALADGVVVRVQPGVVVLDLNGDGDERTGWVILYLHIATDGRATLGSVLKTGDQIGHPSCEGGTSTGTHVHIARKYNGEWIAADSAIPFNLEGWITHNGAAGYAGTLRRENRILTASSSADVNSQLQAGK
jgi:LasA protease